MKVSNSKWKNKSNLQHRVTLAVVSSLLYVIRRKEKKLKKKAELVYYDAALPGSPKIKRARQSVEDVYASLGDIYFKRAYRMTYKLFVRLVEKISPYQPHSDACMARVNGPIPDSTHIAASLRYFGGGSLCNIAPLFGIHFNKVHRSVWQVVDPVNNLPDFAIEYPASHGKQKQIAKSFGKDLELVFNAVPEQLMVS
jgi:hypothetical protein